MAYPFEHQSGSHAKLAAEQRTTAHGVGMVRMVREGAFDPPNVGCVRPRHPKPLQREVYPPIRPKPPRIARNFPYRNGPKTVGTKRSPLSRGALVVRRSGVQIPEAALGRNALRCNRLRRFGTPVTGSDSSVSSDPMPRECPGLGSRASDLRTMWVGETHFDCSQVMRLESAGPSVTMPRQARRRGGHQWHRQSRGPGSLTSTMVVDPHRLQSPSVGEALDLEELHGQSRVHPGDGHVAHDV